MNNKTLFLFSKGVSHAGTKLFTFSLSWYILSQTGSGLSFSLSLLVNYLPIIILSLFVGDLSSKMRRPNRILVLCDVASAAVCCLPLLYLSLISMYAVIFLLAAISAVFNNVIDTRLIDLDGIDSPEALKKLTSASQFITCGINILAPSVGGVLIQILPIQAFAVINIVSFLLSAFGELWLKYRIRQEADGGQSPETTHEKKRAALPYMFGHSKLRTFFVADSLGNFCFTAGVNVALPLIVTTTLGLSSSGYGLISGSIALGSALCALWRTKFPDKTRLQYPFLKLGLIGACMLFLALAAWLPAHAVWSAGALCIIMFVVGWLSVDVNIQTKTALQVFVEPDFLGRVLGISTSISFILIPLSLVIAGGLSEIWPSYALPLLSGTLMIAVLAVLRLAEGRAE